MPEDRLSEGLFLDKPIRDNVVTAVLNRLLGRFGMLDASKGDGLAEHTIKDLQIAAPNIMLPVQSLSGGNQQRVLIGRWLAIEPRVLVLHGPTVVDVGSKDTIYRIVQRLAENGLAVLIISDDLPELLQNCDRILLMRKGHLAGERRRRQSRRSRPLPRPCRRRKPGGRSMSALATTAQAAGAMTAGTPHRGLFARHPELSTLLLIVLHWLLHQL